MNLSKTAGSLVFWSNSFTSTPLEPVLNSFEKHAPSLTEFLPSSAVEDSTAFTRAATRCLARAEGSRDGETSLTRRRDHRDDEVIVTFARDRIDSSKEYKAEHLVTVVFDKATSKVITDDPDFAPVKKLMVIYEAERSKITARDSFAFLPKMFEALGGVRVKKQGCVFFVPSPYDEEIENLEKAISVTGLNIVRWPINRGDVTKAHKKMIQSGLENKLEEFEAKLEAKIESGENVRPTTIDRRFKELKAINDHCELFRDVADDVVERLAKIKERVKGKVEELKEIAFADDEAA